MNQSLHRLVYLSRNEISGGPDPLHREIDAILRVARRNNAKSGITGALLFNAACFAQVLEGPYDALVATFENIQHDMRHNKIAVVAFDSATERKFEHAPMAFIGRQTEAAHQFNAFAAASGFDLAHLDGERLFDLLCEHAYEAQAA